ncbi:hypothetical protein AWC36_05180 [Brenneria goodwinii]|uniref:phage tail tip fiber protein n=1 Tax=Brenneria goodwinii TaxID=1109412 RepID=UPI000BAF5BDD|nr:DUF1983 domain-containing protein [Brenneria goodwinii]ATA23546.1 hypothetical protein AWC36_05180 [Brenneria goodwinii]
MPAAIPIVAAVAAGAAAAAQMYVVAAVIMIAGTVASMLLTKTPGVDNYRSQSERKQVLRAAASPKTVVYGKTMSAGTLFFSEEQSGEQDDGELLYLAITLAGHPLYRIGDIYLADDLIGTYGGNVGYEFHNDRQTADPYLLENAPSWKDDMIGKGVAWLRVTLKFDSEKFPSGIPNIKVEKWGWEVYDPRTGDTAWSDNAALVILHYYRYYLKVPDSEINWEQFEVAANISDESVIRGDGNTERRYTINGEFDLSENKSAILDDMLASCAGEPTYIGGRHGLLVGAYYGPAVEEIHEGQLAGDIEIMPEVSQSDRVNTINGTFIDPEQSYSEADFPAVSVPEWVAEDGVEISQDMKLRFVISEFQSQRLADIKLKRARVARTINLPINLSGYRYRPGMYVKLFLPSLGIDGVEMRVADWQFSIQNGVKLTLKQEGADVWNDAIGKLIDRAPLTNLPNGAPGAPENLSYSTQIIADVVQGLLTWTTRETVAHYNVLFIQNGETIYTAQVPGTQCRVTGLPEGEYIAEVRAVAMNGAQSVPTSITFKINSPAAPDRVDVTPGLWSVELHPRVIAGLPVGTVFEFWFSVDRLSDISLVETNANYLGRGASYTKVGLKEVGKVYWFYVRSVNSYGASAFVEVGASVDSDVAPIFEEAVEVVFETDAWKSLTGQVDEQGNNISQLKDGVDALALGVIENTLNITETRNQLNDAVESISTNITNTRTELEAADAYLTQRVDGYIAENDGRVAQVINDVTTVKNEQEVQAQGLDAVVAKSDDNAALIASEITARIAGDEANAQEIATTKATVADNTGRITSVEQAQATTDSAVAAVKQDIVAQTGRIDGHDQSISHLTTEQQSLANQQETTASAVTGLTSEFNSNKAEVNQSLQTLATNDAAQAQMINGLRADTDDNSAAITELSETVTGQGSSQASVKQSLEAQARAQIQDALNGTEEAQQRRQNVAKITTQQEVQADEQQALARELTQIETGFNGQIASTNAALQQESLTRSTETAALSQQTNALSARMSNAESDIDGTADALSATQATVTQQGQTITSQGQSISQMSATINGVSGVANDAQSKANANATALQQTNATVTQHGNTLTAQATQISQITASVNGVSAEINDVSSIVNGIDNQLSAFRTIKIAVDANGRQYVAGIGLDVSNSTTGMQSNIILLADRTSIMTNAGGTPTMIFTTQGTQAILNSVIIGDATINFAKIANDIQSSVMGANGQPLWKLDKNGSLTMVGPNSGDGYLTINGNLLQVFDGTGFLIARFGIWS